MQEAEEKGVLLAISWSVWVWKKLKLVYSTYSNQTSNNEFYLFSSYNEFWSFM